MELPSIEECNKLFAQYYVPKNIKEHCEAVQALAVSIAQKLCNLGIWIDVQLVSIGALMHDWMKAAAIEKLDTGKFGHVPTHDEKEAWEKLRERFAGKHESEIAHELLKDKYPKFAAFLLHEGSLSHDAALERGWEEKVIHYADWRVLGTKVIPLGERLDDFFVRYKAKILAKTTHAEWEKLKSIEFEYEKEMCKALGVDSI